MRSLVEAVLYRKGVLGRCDPGKAKALSAKGVMWTTSTRGLGKSSDQGQSLRTAAVARGQAGRISLPAPDASSINGPALVLGAMGKRD